MIGARGRAVFAVALVGLLVLSSWVPLAAQEQSPPIDPRTVLLTPGDLPQGFEQDTSQSSYALLTDGDSVAIAIFRQTARAVGPLQIRNTVYSLPYEQAARARYASLPSSLAGQGFSPAAASPVGDDSAGFTSSDTLDGQAVVYQTVVYLVGTVVVVITVVGPPAATTLEQAAFLARATYAHAATNLGLATLPPPGPPQSAPQPDVTAPLASSKPAATLAGPAGILLTATASDMPDISSGLRLGGISGLVALDSAGSQFLAVTDRGPNDEIGTGRAKKMTFPLPGFSPSVIKLQLRDGQIQLVDWLPLKLRPGFSDTTTGTAYVSGLSNTDRDEIPWSRGGADPLAFDPNGIDSEGLALDPRDGTFWICEEYSPSILHVASDGTILYRLVPAGLTLEAPGEIVRDILPQELASRKINRGFEGIGISPDGTTLFAIMQSPLSNPDKDSGEASRNIRLITLDISKSYDPQVIGMYLYLAESASVVGGTQDDVKVGDLAAISSSRALVLERDSQADGRHKMVYSIDLTDATNILGRDPGRGKTYEQMSEVDLRAARVKPVAKAPLADLASYGYRPEKLEGLAIVDDRTIAAVNDNDFGWTGFDENGVAIPSGVDTRLVLVRLDKPLR